MTTVLPGRDENIVRVTNDNKITNNLNEGMAYKAYTTKRRTILASPETDDVGKFKSPENFRTEILRNQRSSDNLSHVSENSVDKFQKNMRENHDEGYSKYPKYKSFSPTYPEVSLPNGSTYRLDDEIDVYSNDNYSVSSESYVKTPRSRYENDEVRSLASGRSRRNSGAESYHGKSSRRREIKRSSRNRSSRRDRHRRSQNDSLSPVSEYDSDDSYNSELEERDQRRRERREEKNRKEQLMELILQDYYDRKKKEKEEKESPKKTNVNQGSFEIPKVQTDTSKQKIPNYEELSDHDKLKAKNKFIDLFQKLTNSYPDWKIQSPDFDNLPLRIIHERYEQVVRTICIYQTAMKWKVYLIIIIAGIEYYGYNVNKFSFLKGLLKQQIKSIHKYNNYLIEIAEMFYSNDDSGEEWPLWIRFLGTILSSLTSFCGVSGLSKLTDFDAPDFAFEQADKFMSPPEGDAKLRTDGISDLPTPPTGFQNPDTVIGIIGKAFGAFTGNHSNNSSQSNNKQSTAQTAPVNAKPLDDDYENVEF